MGIRNKVICSERSNNNAYKTLKLKLLRPIYLILSDRIVCNSYAAADEIKKKLFIRKSKVETIWNMTLPYDYMKTTATSGGRCIWAAYLKNTNHYGWRTACQSNG